MRLIATRSQSYGTRRLVAGERFEARDKHARVLIAIGRAEPHAAAAPSLAPPPAELVHKVMAHAAPAAPEPAAPEPADERPALRAEYKRVTGRNAFTGWDAATLRARIAGHPAP